MQLDCIHDLSLLTFLQEVAEFIPDSDTPSDHVLLKVSIVFVHFIYSGVTVFCNLFVNCLNFLDLLMSFKFDEFADLCS